MEINWRFWEKKPENNTINQGYWNDYFGSSSNRVVPFDGEKTPYEMGAPVELVLDYHGLRARSWEAFISSDLIQNAIRKYCLWIVGSGLKVQCDPIESVLSAKGIVFDREKFTESVESQFRLHANSKDSVWSDNLNLHKYGSEALKNALLSGDVLIIQRFSEGKTTTEVIDGGFVQTPLDYKTKNIIDRGVEIDKRGRHIAYHVIQDSGVYKRIPARGAKTGRLQAWLMYGLRNKLTDVRGLSLLTAVLETSAKMDRYKDAELGKAEENSKIPWVIEHNQFSDGEDIRVKQLQASMGRNKGTAPETDSYNKCEGVAQKVAITTGKTTYNLPPGASLKRNELKADSDFGTFYNVNAAIVYATIGIPPEVAEDRFGGSYSSSRAALKSWEHKMKVDRANTMSAEFYNPIFDYWFDINVFQNNIDAPGYLSLKERKDYIGIEAYLNKRFIGANIPHIDPVKEVNAIRNKLGKSFDDIPLMSADQATEEMNTGDYDNIIKKARNEKNKASDFTPVESNSTTGTV